MKKPTPYTPKLKVGDVVTVHGWIMLDKLDAGRYRIAAITEFAGSPTYSFTKPRGTKRIVRHFCHNVDAWIRPLHHPDGNKIEVKHKDGTFE
jgi:hypothetical protein